MQMIKSYQFPFLKIAISIGIAPRSLHSLIWEIVSFTKSVLPKFLFGVLFAMNAFACNSDACKCSAVASPVNFPYYVAINSSDTTTISSIQVTCSTTLLGQTITYSVGFDGGNSGNLSERYMQSPTSDDKAYYNIYKDSSYTQILGNGENSTFAISNSYTFQTNLDQADQYNIYAVMPASQEIKPGNYSDSINLSIVFQ